MGSSSSLLQPGDRFGDYELVRKIEAGGMGEVWKACQVHSDQLVAFKFIKPHLLDDPANKVRFLNEAKTLARLEHDRIVPLYGVCQDQGRLALILRFIDGESLAQRIDRLGALPVELAVRCARDILPALEFAHDQGIVHRDIKPQNILIDRRDRFFLTDFGIAVTEFAGRGTAEGTSLGTIHYMSPEQIENSRALDPHRGGRRSDVYSFGVVLFEMLTGRLPFGDRHTRDESYRQIVWMHCTAPPPRLGDFNPAVAPTIEAPVLRCLEKDPDQRPQSCGELLMMLDQAAAAAGRERPDHEQTWVENKGAYTPTVHLSSSTSDSATAHPKAVATNPRRSDSGSVVTKGARKPIGRTVWLGLAGLCIVALVGYAVVTGALKKGPTTQVPPKVATADTKPIKPAPPPDKSVPPPVKSAVYKAAPNSTKSNRGNTDAPPVPGAGHLYDQDSGSQRK